MYRIGLLLAVMGIWQGVSEACVSYPSIETKGGCEIQFDERNYRQDAEIVSILHAKRTECDLTDDDVAIVKEFVQHGYTVAEQTDEEYATFLRDAQEEQANTPLDCRSYEAIAHRGRWTGVIKTGESFDEEWGCMTARCASAVDIDPTWNDLNP